MLGAIPVPLPAGNAALPLGERFGAREALSGCGAAGWDSLRRAGGMKGQTKVSALGKSRKNWDKSCIPSWWNWDEQGMALLPKSMDAGHGGQG